jgi:AAA domain
MSEEILASSGPLRAPRVGNPRGEWLRALLRHVNPYSSDDSKVIVMQSIHQLSGGSAEGLSLLDEWHRNRSDYPGAEALATVWQSVRYASTQLDGFAVLCGLVESYGFDWVDICDATEPQFVECESDAADQAISVTTLLVAYSLTGQLKHLKRDIATQVRILDALVLLGQVTVLFAAPNSGKTLLALSLLIKAIEQRRLDPSRVFYVNADDSLAGLAEKLELAERYGFHMLAEGYRGFRASDFLRILSELTDRGQAQGVVIVLDTLKKFTDVMDKRTSTEFSKVIRRFVLQGGTCIMLAHTNKRPGKDGRPEYAGTSDILEDVDCGYIFRVISAVGAREKVVEFTNIKRRGDVCQRAVYAYSGEEGISYGELLASVRQIDESELDRCDDSRTDSRLIEVAMDCIRMGINTKMALATAVAHRTGCSKRVALKLVERCTGNHPGQHFWTYEIQARGAKVFKLLPNSTTDASSVT